MGGGFGSGSSGWGKGNPGQGLWEAMEQLRGMFEQKVAPRMGKGDVRAAVLALLAEKPMHGYQIISEIAERSGGAWKPSAGSVYPTLQLLADEGLSTSRRGSTCCRPRSRASSPGCRTRCRPCRSTRSGASPRPSWACRSSARTRSSTRRRSPRHPSAKRTAPCTRRPTGNIGYDEAVVKVQRPGIEVIVDVDLSALRRVAGWLSRVRFVGLFVGGIQLRADEPVWGVALMVASAVPLLHAVIAGLFGRRGPR